MIGGGGIHSEFRPVAPAPYRPYIPVWGQSIFLTAREDCRVVFYNARKREVQSASGPPAS